MLNKKNNTSDEKRLNEQGHTSGRLSPGRTRVLVLCTGNSCRSQMAEGFFRHFGAARIEAHSAGLKPQPVNPRTIQVMKEIGIDISTHTSKHLADYLTNEFDYVITVCDNADQNCPAFPGKAARLHWPFPDPAKATGADKEILKVFRTVRDEISRKVQWWLGEL
jgi:arsenate reductase